MHNRILNCAVIGLGVGEQHARMFLQHPNTRLTDILDLDSGKITNFIIENSLKIKSRSLQEILSDEQHDLVSIASYDDHHFEQIIACLKHGKHVFVEKPLCQTIEQLASIYRVWRTSELGLCSNLVLRKAPLYLWLKEQIASERLGEIYSFEGDYLYGRMDKITQGWRKNVDNYSVMAGGAIHLIDLMMWLTNQKPTHVTSQGNKIATKQTEFQYHDFQIATFSFKSGLIGKITANFGCVHKHQHVLKIFGTKGTFIYDDMGARMHFSRDVTKPERPRYSPLPQHKGVLIEDFILQVLSNNVISSAEREFDLMSTVLAADEALQQQQHLKIEYLTC